MTGRRLAGLLAAALGACASMSAPPDQPPSITGTITHVTHDPASTRVLIEERPGEPSGSDKSSVRITARTRVLIGTNGATRPFPRDQLAVGMRASAWFEGPVAESYPTQATAGTLLVRR